jgi:hypothetical protein
LLERVKCEPVWLRSPCLADELVGREPFEGLEPAAEVVSDNEVGEALTKLVMTVVVEALDGRILDSAVHPLDLAIGPWMPGFGCTVLDIFGGAGILEGMGPEELPFGDCFLD